MKMYLSSYKIGDKAEKLKEFVPPGKALGFVPNALDYVEPKARQESNSKNIKDLTDLGVKVEVLDLTDFFGKKELLKQKLERLGGVWVRGGNTFVLRQAMHLSGFDELIKKVKRDDFVYGGYSAGVCVLAPTLKGLQRVDNPSVKPYGQDKETIWEGLGMLDYLILPHYQSKHPESPDVEKEVEFCKKEKIKFKTLRDGEVIIIE